MEKNRLEVLLEDMHSKIDAVTELDSGMAEDVTFLKQDVGILSTNMATLKCDDHVMKAVITEQSRELKDTKEARKRPLSIDGRIPLAIDSLRSGRCCTSERSV